jgi:WhiB family redox-sensing transcriptional regulator
MTAPDQAAALPYGLQVDQVARITRQERAEFLAAMRREGACRDRDPELFFPLSGHGAAHREQVEEATQVCRSCPLAAQCVSYALSGVVEYGIWGGTTEQDRRPWLRAVTARRQEIAAEATAAATA